MPAVVPSYWEYREENNHFLQLLVFDRVKRFGEQGKYCCVDPKHCFSHSNLHIKGNLFLLFFIFASIWRDPFLTKETHHSLMMASFCSTGEWSMSLGAEIEQR